MAQALPFSLGNVSRDFLASIVVCLVVLPLSMGVAVVTGEKIPLFSGIVAAVVGGVVVGAISGSRSSISGPTAGLTSLVALQVAFLGSFEAFLYALFIAGAIQIVLGIARLGFFSSFFPSSVIHGLLAAIGVILILKQLPHLVGHDIDPEGEMSFIQQDKENTFTELFRMVGDMHPGAVLVGITSFAIAIFWDAIKPLRKLAVPSSLIIIAFGIALSEMLTWVGGGLAIGPTHRVQAPTPATLAEFGALFRFADFSQFTNPMVYLVALSIALIASLETLLSVEAVDKIDPQQRVTPTNRELIAQGVGNIINGLVGGLPVTSVIVNSSVNLNAGAQTQLSAISYGVLTAAFVFFFPSYLNHIPIACLAAILLATGIKLASPWLFMRMWKDGYAQFVPFLLTLLAIFFTDLLAGALIGLGLSLAFILSSNLRRPLRIIVEKRHEGEVTRIELANQVSFLNRAVIDKALEAAPRGSHLLIDARHTDYIDPDVLSLLREFRDRTAPARKIQFSLYGFSGRFPIEDQVHLKDYTTKEIQSQLTPGDVLQLLKEGNERFRSGNILSRDFRRQLNAAGKGQHPLAVILSCIDSRSPAELIFDLGLGDIFSVRVAGNITSPKVLGSMEYACAVAGAKLVLVLGHSQCGAVNAAVSLASSSQSVAEATGCGNLEPIMSDIQRWIDKDTCNRISQVNGAERAALVDNVAKQNVIATVRQIRLESETLARLAQEGKIAIVGAMYEVGSGKLEFLGDTLVDSTDSLVRADGRPQLTH
jgi:MFS superfamily sulfate permease-like transporter